MGLRFDFFQVDYMRAMCPCPPSSSCISLFSCMAIVPTGKPRSLVAQWMSTHGQGAASVVPEHFCRLPPSVWRGPLLNLLPCSSCSLRVLLVKTSSSSAQAAVMKATEGGFNNRCLFLLFLGPGSPRSRCQPTWCL